MARAVPLRQWLLIGLALGLVVVGGVLAWLFRPTPLPAPGSDLYEQYAEAFEKGTAALDVGVDDIAEPNLSRAVELIPQEPAGWANRGLLYLRENRLELAVADLSRARSLAPNNKDIEFLLGMLAARQGRIPQAIQHLHAALQSDPKDVMILYQLAQLTAQEGGNDADERYQQLIDQILAIQPGNLVALRERLKVAFRRGDAPVYVDTWRKLEALSSMPASEGNTTWAKRTSDLLQRLKPTPEGTIPPDVQLPLRQFENVLKAEPAFARSRDALDVGEVQAGNPLHNFVKLPPLRNLPAAADHSLTWEPQAVTALPGIRDSRWDVAVPVWFTAQGPPTLVVANGKEVRRTEQAGFVQPFPSGRDAVAPSDHGVLAVDWNNDLLVDLVLAGAGGLRFLQQGKDGSFKDVTRQTGLPADVLQGDHFGVWAVDVDLDGDLDIIVAPRKGSPLLLRNNRDGTFLRKPIFPGVDGLRVLAWADFDNDGAPDFGLLDSSGRLHVFRNERLGQLTRRPSPELPAPVAGLTVGEVGDGSLDLVVLLRNGSLVRVADRDKGKQWATATLAQIDSLSAEAVPGTCQLFLADLDNNGRADLVVSCPGQNAFLLADSTSFQPLSAPVKQRVQGVADINGDGRLDLAVLSGEGPMWLLGKGSREYHWQAIRPRALRPDLKGDDRINSFGIGGEAEIRTGTLVVKQPISAPVVHFGLGEHPRADVIRLQWPNGTFQVEFEQPPDTVVTAVQRLKGSCPFLFAWDGKRMVFVGDFLWSSPLGMYINAQKTAVSSQTTDWMRIRGEQLVPRDGYLDVRVQANLWETHYVDHLALLAVDHPPDTELYVDERFFLTPTKPRFYLTEPARPVGRAWDHEGKDATEDVRAVDGRHLDRAGRGRFQGVTRDHWVEVDLGPDAPREGPVLLIAHGFVHPTDSSINFALEQGQHDRPRGLVLEVPDGRGGWKVGRGALGFPAGKNKTVVLRLDGIEGAQVSRRFRLRTNMEIYWDALLWAREVDPSVCQVQTLAREQAQLRFRGILEMTQANQSSPELPHYDRVINRQQYWRDLIGWHTRYGDVGELLEKIDDRYVIMNAGDEIALRYKSPPRKEGWSRDYIHVGDGWEKDGDFNTRFGKTVLPLPSHDQVSYDRPPGLLEDDPVYRRFPGDWEKYHTRYVTPDLYERGLSSFRRKGGARLKP